MPCERRDAFLSTAPSSSSWTASASASCRMRPPTATRAATPLGNIAEHVPLQLPTLRSLGLTRVVALGVAPAPPAAPLGAFGRMAEASPGKDSVTGHWEMMGIVLDRPFPTFPHGFPPEIIAEFERAHRPRRRSATWPRRAPAIIDELGAEHMRTGAPIVYTSADSVFQIAAHEDVVPVAELYALRDRLELVGEGMGVGRVIARPFVGAPGAFTRTANRHDYALPPTGRRCSIALDGGRSCRSSRSARSTTCSPAAASREAIRHGQRRRRHGRGRGADAHVGPRVIFANLVDFDTQYGHATTSPATRETSSASTGGWPALLPRLRDDDLLFVTADHGNDPTTPSTDHSREYVPLLVTGARVRAGVRSARGRPSPISGRRWPSVSASAPLAHGTSFLGRSVARDDDHPRTARGARARDARAAGGQERRHAGRLRPEPEDESGRRFSAIAIASSTARRSGG